MKRTVLHNVLRSLIILCLVPLTVPGQRPVSTAKTYRYTVPAKTNDGWETAHLSTENIDPNLVKDLFDRIIDNSYKNIHSVLIVRNGKLVVEEYFAGMGADTLYHSYKRDTLHYQASVTKSVNSILIGIAIDQHLIRGVDEKISTFFPEYSDIFADSAKTKIRLRDCLSMTAGLDWNEWRYPYTDPRNDHIMMNNSNDPIRYDLERPVAETSNTKFVYSSGISITLGQIIYNVSGMRADKFADRHLFAPLGIKDYFWRKYPNGTVQTGGGLVLRPRDMAKIGYLVLNGGRWQGKQIVSEEWVRESTRQQAPHPDYGFPWWMPSFLRYLFLTPIYEHYDYGYQWWLRSYRVGDRTIASYGAEGRGGQLIAVLPQFEMVAVFTGWNDNELWKQQFDILQRYVLPAVISHGK